MRRTISKPTVCMSLTLTSIPAPATRRLAEPQKEGAPRPCVLRLIFQNCAEELATLFSRRVIENRVGLSAFDNSAAGKESDPLGNHTRETHFVCDQNQVTPLLKQFLDHIKHFSSHFGIQCGS